MLSQQLKAEIEKKAKSHVSDMNNFPDTYTGSAVKASMLKSYITGATHYAADREKLIECLKLLKVIQGMLDNWESKDQDSFNKYACVGACVEIEQLLTTLNKKDGE